MTAPGRIIYNSINIDFERIWRAFKAPPILRQDVIKSAGGIEEILNYEEVDMISALRPNLTPQEYTELRQWWEYVKDGTSFELLRDRELGAYLSFEKTLENHDGNAGTFTRTAGDASNASYIDPSTGLLTFEDVADTPRYPGGKFGHGVIIEGTRDNLILNSDMSHADWVKSNITVAADSTDILDPAGGNNADKLTATAAAGTVTLTTSVDVGTDDGALSWDVACLSGTVEGEIRIRDVSGSVVTTQAFTATPTWQRIQAVYDNVGDPSADWRIIIQVDTNTEDLYVYGPQLEAGSNVLFASNYIRGDLSAELMPNQVDRDFSGASAWADVDLAAGGGSYDESGDLSITAGGAGAGDYCTCPVASAPTTVGLHYRMTFDLANLAQTWIIKSFDGTQTIGTASANGTAIVISWIATTTGGYRIEAGANNAVGDFDNFTLQRITKTRNDELLLGTAANVVNNLKGSVGFWFKPEWVYDKHANACLYRVHNSGDASRHSSIYALSNGNLEFDIRDSANNSIGMVVSMNGLISQNTWHHIVATYDSTISNGNKLYVDGALVVTDTNDPFVPAEIGTSYAIGATPAGADEAFCVFDEELVRMDVLNATDIKHIFDAGHGLGEPKNRFTALRALPPFDVTRRPGSDRWDFRLEAKEVIS